MRKTKKTEEFYIALAEKLVAAGAIETEKLTSIISEVNLENGYKTIQVNSIGKYKKEIKEIYGDDFENVREGKKCLCSLKKVNKERILNYFHPNTKAGVVTKKDNAYREAYLNVAKEVMEENPNLSREKAVISARKRVKKLDEKQLFKGYCIVKRFNSKESRVLLKDEDCKVIKNLTETLKSYKINLGVTEISRKTYKLKRSKDEILNDLRTLAWEKLHLKLDVEKDKKVIITPLSQEESYVVLIIRGMIKMNSEKFVSISQVMKILRDNRYRKFDLSRVQIEEIIKKVPQYLEIKRGTEDVNRTGDDWSEIYEKFAPKNQEWIIPWCVNSGIKLEEVREIFPESYQEGENVTIGSQILMIKADRSIRSFQKLAKLSEKFRDIDFPIGEKDLKERCKDENQYLEQRLFYWMSGKRDPLEIRGGMNLDKIMIQIEEGYI